MDIVKQSCCENCGGDLYQLPSGQWKCQYCSTLYDDKNAQAQVDSLRQLLDEAKMETISNLRRNLYDAVNATYISSEKIITICTEIKKYLPDDFHANFYEMAVAASDAELADYILNINIDEHYSSAESILRFLLRSPQPAFMLAVSDLIERAFKGRDLEKYDEFSVMFSTENEKVNRGVYETKLPRDVFVAYSSKDMRKVIELVEYLEAQGLRCFVATRNLRHGKGAVENYNKALEEAMTSCKTFVFVSSVNSRSFGCDAVRIEIPFVKQLDIDSAPPEYHNHYDKIPENFKKYRVEYRLDESGPRNLIVDEFFEGYEWALSPDVVAKRVFDYITASPVVEKPKEEAPKKKFCAECGHENSLTTKFCAECGHGEFVSSIAEFIQMTKKKKESTGSTGGPGNNNYGQPNNSKNYGGYNQPNVNNYGGYSQPNSPNNNYGGYSQPNSPNNNFGGNIGGFGGGNPETNNNSGALGSSFGGVSQTNTTSTSSKPAKSPKNFWVTLLLCLFLGFFGGHRFYVGKKVTAVLFMFSYGGLFIGLISDFLKIITGRFTDKDNLPIRP